MSNTKERQVVEKLLRLQFGIWDKADKLEDLGISIDGINTCIILETALDLIGFPATNIRQFDAFGDRPHLRQDLENIFTREYLEDPIFEAHQQHKTAVSFSELADRLYAEFEAYQTGTSNE